MERRLNKEKLWINLWSHDNAPNPNRPTSEV